jgi:hypothetical protein
MNGLAIWPSPVMKPPYRGVRVFQSVNAVPFGAVVAAILCPLAMPGLKLRPMVPQDCVRLGRLLSLRNMARLLKMQIVRAVCTYTSNALSDMNAVYTMCTCGAVEWIKSDE